MQITPSTFRPGFFSIRNFARGTLGLLVLAGGLLAGCTRNAATQAAETVPSTVAQRQALDGVRQQMEQIPPPSKNRYLAVHSLAAWENPYVTVNGGMLTLHVLVADANHTDLGVGTVLRPKGARMQSLNIRVGDLAIALNSIPADAWPYGRVVALEEAHDVPASARPQVRRNMESAEQILNDVGVVVYEWNEPLK